ncbi:hypothetical protein [Streptomyces antibioticus]|uniref:hypothetical protein n=1 Tax=Streptomyces antibioticus TaxID=1890 RepID=UPI0036FA4131
MSQTEDRTDILMTAIAHLESGAFRAGQVARRLMTEHPGLTVHRATCSTHSYGDTWGPVSGVPLLDLRADDLDGARAWATALSTTLTLGTREHSGSVFQYGDCEAAVDGVRVRVTGSRTLPEDEGAAWRAQQTTAPEGGEG